MAWWQVVLIILGSIAVGLAVGLVSYYVIVQVGARAKATRPAEVRTAPALSSVMPPAAAVKPGPAPTVKPGPAPTAKPGPVPTVQPGPVLASKPDSVPVVKSAEPRLTETSPADLVAEIDTNRRLAGGAWNGKLQQFQTRAWDNRGDEVHALPPDLRSQIAEAYSDMSLANSIVWLATEMGRRSESLDDSYLKLRSSVAVRLDQICNRLGVTDRPVSPA